MRNLLIVAGENSGDQHAAKMLAHLKEQYPDLQTWGYGGEKLEAEGMEILEHCRDLAVMGITEVLKRYGYFKRIFRELLQEIETRKPDALLLVDYPGFNLRLAAALKGSGIPIIQYVCPQVWAWKAGRIQKMERDLHGVLCLFPFEPPLFEQGPLAAELAGHPLVDGCAGVLADDQWGGEGPKLALLPGSRSQEIERLFVPMLDTLKELRKTQPDLQVRVPAANKELLLRMQELLKQEALDGVRIQEGGMRELVKGADVALVCSGTATLECGLLGTPLVLAYKTSALTYAIGKRVVKVPHIGLVNLVADNEVCKEFIQDAFTAEAVAEEVASLLPGTEKRDAQILELQGLHAKLRSDEGGRRPAQLFLDMLKSEHR